MFGIPILIPGLILLLAGSHWFAGAATVGWILTIAGAIPVVFFIGVMVIAIVAYLVD